jgi:hypothetical protein
MSTKKKRQNANVDGRLGSNSSMGPIAFSVSNKEDQLISDVVSRHYLDVNGRSSASVSKSDRIAEVMKACQADDLKHQRMRIVMPLMCKCEVSLPAGVSETNGVDGVEVMDEKVSTTGSIDLVKDVVDEAYSGYHNMNGRYVRVKTGSRFNLDATEMIKGKDRYPFRLISSLMCGRTIGKLVEDSRAGILDSTINLTSSSKKLIGYKGDYIIGWFWYVFDEDKYYFSGFEAEISIVKNGLKVSGRNPTVGLEEIKDLDVEVDKNLAKSLSPEERFNSLSPEVRAFLNEGQRMNDALNSQNVFDRDMGDG